MRITIILIFIILTLIAFSNAQINIFSGNDSNWNNINNWSLNMLPNSSQTVHIHSNCTLQFQSTSITIYELVVDGDNAIFNIQSELNILNDYDNEGLVFIEDTNVIINSANNIDFGNVKIENSTIISNVTLCVDYGDELEIIETVNIYANLEIKGELEICDDSQLVISTSCTFYPQSVLSVEYDAINALTTNYVNINKSVVIQFNNPQDGFNTNKFETLITFKNQSISSTRVFDYIVSGSTNLVAFQVSNNQVMRNIIPVGKCQTLTVLKDYKAVVGVFVAGFIVLLAISVVLCCCLRKKTKTNHNQMHDIDLDKI